MGAAVVYSALIGLYLLLFERDVQEAAPQPLADVFYKLTYRRKYEELLGKSGQDALTGALTRERFDTTGPAILARAGALRRPLSLAMLDVDHFKSINDRYGHIAGDEVLRRVVECLRGEIRGEDAIFRYGGEEFVILCENMPHAAALAHADRMRVAVHRTLAQEFAAAPTISIGVATFPDDAPTLRDLLAHADRHLYDAKRRGRDRVVGNAEHRDRTAAG